MSLAKTDKIPPGSEEPGEAAGKPAMGAGPIWEEILKLSESLSPEEVASLPEDLAEEHDHYIYGTPKTNA